MGEYGRVAGKAAILPRLPDNKVRDQVGTLWMGNDPPTPVTNLNDRFHTIVNTYVAGPTLFPTIGSANLSLTAFALARRTTEAI